MKQNRIMLNDKIIKESKELAAEGLPQQYIPLNLSTKVGTSTFYLWKNKGIKAREKPVAKRTPNEKLYVALVEALEQGRANSVRHSIGIIKQDVDWKAHMTYLERQNPKEFGKKTIFDEESMHKYFRNRYGEEGWNAVEKLINMLEAKREVEHLDSSGPTTNA